MFKLKVPEIIKCHATSIWDHKMGGKAQAGNVIIPFDIPKEFGGPGEKTCPGDIFLSSIIACLTNIFVFILKDEVKFVEDIKMDSDCEIILRKEGYSFRTIKVNAYIRAKTEKEKRIISLFKIASKYCYITKLAKAAVPVEVYLYINDKGPIIIS